MMTKVVNLYKANYDVYIGRPKSAYDRLHKTDWGNPFIIGKHGNREQVIAQYETLMRERLNEPHPYWREELEALKGKTLGCFCKPQACHGDVLVKLINEYFPD